MKGLDSDARKPQQSEQGTGKNEDFCSTCHFRGSNISECSSSFRVASCLFCEKLQPSKEVCKLRMLPTTLCLLDVSRRSQTPRSSLSTAASSVRARFAGCGSVGALSDNACYSGMLPTLM